MYACKARALVWVESAQQSSDTAVPPVANPKPQHSPACRELLPTCRWARRPFHGQLGHYVAVHQHKAKLDVAIYINGQLLWHDAQTALSKAEAERWAREGF